MSELVTCGECGTRYDSDRDAFCPRCGSTAKGQITPAALQVARRNDPGRRRVQAAGALLLLVGTLFLVFSVVLFVAPLSKLLGQMVGPMAASEGGEVVFLPSADHTPFDVKITDPDGKGVLVQLVNQTEPVTIPLDKHAGVNVTLGHDGNEVRFQVIALPDESITVEVASVRDGEVLTSDAVRGLMQAMLFVFAFFAIVLAGGGVASILLRLRALAVVAASIALFLGLVVLFGFLFYGLLFAVPLGFAAVFILRGKRHFRRKGE